LISAGIAKLHFDSLQLASRLASEPICGFDLNALGPSGCRPLGVQAALVGVKSRPVDIAPSR